MNKDLGEIFYDGKIISLSSANVSELTNILMNLRNGKIVEKEKIDENLKQMRGD